MNLDELSEKLSKIQESLREETSSYNSFVKNLYENNPDNIDLKQEYYHTLDEKEKLYQQKNNEYKELISGFSESYLEMSSFYVGSDLPRYEDQTFLDSKADINLLYFMFLMSMFLKESDTTIGF